MPCESSVVPAPCLPAERRRRGIGRPCPLRKGPRPGSTSSPGRQPPLVSLPQPGPELPPPLSPEPSDEQPAVESTPAEPRPPALGEGDSGGRTSNDSCCPW